MGEVKVKFVAPGIQVRFGRKGNTIRYFASVGGGRVTGPCTLMLPYDELVNPKTRRPTKVLRDDYSQWLAKMEEERGSDKYGLRVPTCGELIETYERLANERRLNPNFGEPSEKAIYSAMNNYGHCVEEAGLEMSDTVDKLLDTAVIQGVFDRLCERMKGVSAWSKIMSLKSVTAYWTELKYKDLGFSVPKNVRLPDKPRCAVAPQYQMMSPERREKVETFYLRLAQMKDQWMYLAASMMVELAMRPIDIGLLTSANFVDDPTDPNGFKHLRYQPHKTRNSSGRWVDWPIKPAHWEQIRAIAGERLDAGKTLLPCRRYTFDKLNPIMRAMCDIDDESKACYELRKFCIDTVYRTLGPNAAVAISGDRIETVMKYYSDPYKIIVEKPVEVMPLGEIKRAEEDGEEP